MTDNRKTPPQFPTDLGKRVVNIPGPARPERLPGAAGDGRRLIVGRDICLSGEITACDTLVVEGRVEATLNDSHRIEISETGYFKGKVDIAVAEIKGKFEGDLVARERLIVRKSGEVAGNVQYAELEIERGGRLYGDVRVIAGPGSAHGQMEQQDSSTDSNG